MSSQYELDRYIPTVEAYICPLHRKNILGVYPGCSCLAKPGMRRATDSEFLRRKRQRLLERRERLLEELRSIDAELD